MAAGGVFMCKFVCANGRVESVLQSLSECERTAGAHAEGAAAFVGPTLLLEAVWCNYRHGYRLARPA